METLVPMTQPEFLAYIEESVPGYAADKIASGQWSETDALALSRKSLEELLPQGLATPDNHLFTIVGDDSLRVGMLWIAIQDRANRRVAYVYDVSIQPEHRRRGHAVRAFEALQAKVRDMGLAGIALHVFGHNRAAQDLYTKLGFVTTNINMFKPI